MSLASTYQSRKELLANVLTSRGVSASASEGLTSLINKVANIPPTVVNMVLETRITAHTTSDITLVGGSVMVNGVLKCFYDDTTPVNVDLNGELQGATVSIYNGNTLLGSCVTDADGVFSFQYTPSSVGVLELIAVFEGTNNFPACTSSSMSVEVFDNATLTLSTDKDIVALNNHDSAVLTATLLDETGNPVVGQTINFLIDDNVVGSSVTNADGEAEYNYTATGAGDVNIVASFAGLCRETCQLIDFFVQDPTSHTISQGYVTSEGGRHKLIEIAEINTDFYFSIIAKHSNLAYQYNYGISVREHVADGDYNDREWDYFNNLGFGGNKGISYCVNKEWFDLREAPALSTNTEYLYEIYRQGDNFRAVITQVNNNTVVYDKTLTWTGNELTHLCVYVWQHVTFTYREVTVKRL